MLNADKAQLSLSGSRAPNSKSCFPLWVVWWLEVQAFVVRLTSVCTLCEREPNPITSLSLSLGLCKMGMVGSHAHGK